MTLAEVVAGIRAGTADSTAWAAARVRMEELGHRGGVVAEFREDAVAHALEVLVAMADDGRLVGVESPDAFFYRVTRNKSISLWRIEQRRLRVPPESTPVSAPPDTMSMARMLAIIEDLKGSAILRRPVPNREEVAASIDRMLRMAVDGLRTADVVTAIARDEGIELATAADLARLADRVDQRHSRARSYLLAVIEMRRPPPEVADEYREAVRLLRRRQENRRPASPREGSP